MPRWTVLVAVSVAGLVLTGCSSDATAPETEGAPKDNSSPSATASTSATATATAEASPSPDPTYFSGEESDLVNKAAAAAQSAGAATTAARRLAACNKITAYPGWRQCWRRLLQPYSAGLKDVAGTLTTLQKGDFPPACRSELADGAQRFTSFADQIDTLLAGLESPARSQQLRSAKRYSPTLNRIAGDFAEPFQKATQVCYSPEVLASVNADPSASP